MGRSLSPPQIHWKIIWTLTKFHKTTTESWWRTPGTQKSNPFCSKGRSVQFSCSVVSNSLRAHKLQHARPPCPWPTQEFTETHVHLVGDSIQPSHSLSSPFPPALNPPQDQSLFQRVNSSHEVAKELEFQPQHQSFQWTPGLVSFRMDWLDLLAVQGTLKSLLQHHGSKASILWCSAFFTVQLSHPYMTQ